MVNIDLLSELYFSQDEPVPYKLKCGAEILINPVKVKDWSVFNSSLQILIINKNEIDDDEIIQMSYLSFLSNLAKQDKNLLYKLGILIKHSLQEEIISIEKSKGKDVLAILDKDESIKYFISSKEFDDIKKIMLFQNIYDYDDRYVSPDVRELYEQYVRAKANPNQEDPTLERKKVFVIGKTGNSMKEINEMSYRTFSQIYNTNVEIDLYYARKIIQASPNYKVGEDVIYPLFEKRADKYSGLFLERSTLDNKFSKIQ